MKAALLTLAALLLAGADRPAPGYLAGASLVAVWHGNAEFRADMDAVRAELAALGGVALAPKPDRCRIETKTN